MIKYANTCEMGGDEKERKERTRGEITDMTTTRGAGVREREAETKAGK